MNRRTVKARRITIADLGREDELFLSYSPSKTEKEQICKDLQVLAIHKLQISGSVLPYRTKDWELVGKLAGRIVQECKITLEPIPTRINIGFARRYVSDTRLLDPLSNNRIPDDDSLEPLEPVVDLFDLARELLFLEIPRFPLKPGAEFHFSDTNGSSDPAPDHEAVHPLAKLGEIYKKPC